MPAMEMARGQLERSYVARGYSIIGVDEVGRGCLAGPVFAGAARLNYDKLGQLSKKELALIRDSKTLSAAQRQKALGSIHLCTEAHAIGEASVEEIEKLGILDACFLAMRRAIAKIQVPRSLLLVDGKLKLRDYAGDQHPVVKGDNLCFAIAAAAIIAKEARDAVMREAATAFPGYGFEDHVGYGTKKHLASIERQGICSLHRRNFAPIRERVIAS